MSKRHESNAARKGPKQQRSKVTVAAILEATVRVLEQEGSDAATTSRIAEVAGVSVGTLYQYFANRDAILDALQDREFERATEMMNRVLARGAYATDREVARAVIEGLLELHSAAPALHRLLVVEGLRVTPTERVQAFDMRIIAVVRSFLEAGEPAHPPHELGRGGVRRLSSRAREHAGLRGRAPPWARFRNPGR